MIVQIYEIQTLAEAERCIHLGVDHIGSVIPNESTWRLPTLKEVIRSTEGTTVKNSLIPLFGEEETLYRAMDYYRPHYVHFCGSLTDAQGRSLNLDPFLDFQLRFKERFPQIDIIRSIPVPAKGTMTHLPFLGIAHALQSVSDLFLIDTWHGKEPVKGFIGITGRPADWERARDLPLETDIPVILAGGLSPENVYDAVMLVIPAGADSCTLTNQENERGRFIRFRKDFDKVRNFVKEVRRAEKALEGQRLELKRKLSGLKAELRERETALPPHSVQPRQIMAIETLEEDISRTERELKRHGTGG